MDAQGQWLQTWQDARLPAVAVAVAWFIWRRDLLGTILSGTAVMLAFRLGLGW
jgi:branched-subunit amino acid transport protein